MWWLTTILFLGCGEEEGGKEWKGEWQPSVPAVLVKSGIISTGTVTDTIEVTGTLENIDQVNIIPETTGVIQSIAVREGDVVTKNQILAQVINANAVANLERSQIEVERVTREFNKSKRLQAQGAISEREFQDLPESITELPNPHCPKRKPPLKRYRAPIDGVIALVNVREGELATTTQLFQIVQPDRLRLVASVPERDLIHLKESQSVEIQAAYSAEHKVTGTIERIAPVVDPTTGSVRVFINVEEGQQVLRPGQFVKAQVEVDRHENTIVVPKDGVVYEDGEAYAYIVTDAPPEASEESEGATDKPSSDEKCSRKESSKEDSTPKLVADRRSLQLGYSDTRWVEVLEGVALNEQIITVETIPSKITVQSLLKSPFLKRRRKKMTPMETMRNGRVIWVVRRPVATWMIAIALLVFGWVSYQRLPLNLMPDLAYPTITVRTTAEGYAPEEVESQVSQRIEESVATTPGLSKLESRSKANGSDVILSFQWGTPMDQAIQNVREQLQVTQLPDDVERPLILRYDPTLDPIIRIALSKPIEGNPENTLSELRQVAERLIKKDLEAMDGVAAVRIRGGFEQETQVLLREDWLQARNVTIQQVIQTLQAENAILVVRFRRS